MKPFAKVSRIRDYYPDYVGSASDYELIVEVYLGKSDKAAAIWGLYNCRHRWKKRHYVRSLLPSEVRLTGAGREHAQN